MNTICRLWRGDLALEEAFWKWAVAGGLTVNIASSATFLLLMTAGQIVPAILIGYGLSLPYNLIASVGVWRSADRHEGDRRWAELARAITVTGMILLSIT